MKKEYARYAPTIIRVLVGLLFVIPGFNKLMNPSGIIGMLGGMGFPAAAFFGWLLLISEIVFGTAVIVGFKVKYTVWPLVIVLAVATVMVTIPNMGQPMGMIGLLWHLLGLGALVSVFLSGPGALGIDKA